LAEVEISMSLDRQTAVPHFSLVREQMNSAAEHLDDDQIITLADDLHDLVRRRLAMGLRSRPARTCTFGDVVFEEVP
jgi:hypothetical protein